MDLDVRDVAKLLNTTEEKVYRWARKGVLPAHRIDEDQYRFNRVELQEWAAARGKRVSKDLFGSAGDLPRLAAALERGGVHHGVGGTTRIEVLEAVSRLPGVPAGVDRALLAELLIGRELLGSSGVGDGIAIPHPRDPLVVRVDAPVVLLGLLERPVDFGAPDGRPVRIVFTLLSPSVRSHLQMLARLASALHDDLFKELLAAAAPAEAIVARVRALDEIAR